MYIRTYVFVSFETTPVVRIQILIDPTFNKADQSALIKNPHQALLVFFQKY